jgi:hypothetical protein
MIFLSLTLLSSLTGCGLLPTPCEQLVTMACDECDVSQSFEDTVCECVENGEVDNAQRYYNSKDEAEIACASTKNQLQSLYQTNDEQVQCRRDLKILKDFGDDGCEYLGFSSDSDSYYGYESEENSEESSAE